jgi:GNAT superfamily N-acetyltransferase
MPLETRLARTGDADALEAFIREAYGPLARYKDRVHWNWQFWDNPYRRSQDDCLPVAVALSGGDIVGQIAVQPAQFKVGSELVPGGWIVDVFILPQYRGQGLGHALHRMLVNDFPLLLTLTMAPATRHIAQSAGAHALNPCFRFAKLLRANPRDVKDYISTRLQHRAPLQAFSRSTLRWTAMDYAIAPLVNAVASLRWLGAQTAASSDLTVTEVPEFSEEIDRLWQRSASDYAAIVPRDRAFLNWRFARSPHLNYRLYVARRGGECVGYSVLRKANEDELRVGIVVDMFAARGDDAVIGALLRSAEDMLSADVAALECAFSDPSIVRLLRRAGYLAIGSAWPTAVCTGAPYRAALEGHFLDWHFSKADHDWDQVHLASR